MKLIFWVHLILILLVYLSPFLISWKLITVFIFLYYLQLLILGDCILTRKEFKTRDRSVTFYYFYLTKLGFKLKPGNVRIVVDYIVPWVLLALAFILQHYFASLPLIRIPFL